MIFKAISKKRRVRGWIEDLRNERAAVREQAAKALGETGDPKAVEPLIRTLADESSFVRLEATRALGKIGDSRAVESLIRALREDDQDVQRKTIESLGMIRDAKAVDVLMSFLKGENTVSRNLATEALVRIGKPAVNSLIEALKNEQTVVRSRAAEALGKIGDSRAVESLIPHLEDEDEWVRQHVAESLAKLGYKPSSVKEQVDILITARTNALAELTKLGKSALIHLIRVAETGRTEERAIAIDALGRIGDRQAVEPLIRVSQNASLEELPPIVSALGKLGSPKAIEQLIKLALQDGRLRDEVTEALVEIGLRGEEIDLEPIFEVLKGGAEVSLDPARNKELSNKQLDSEALKTVTEILGDVGGSAANLHLHLYLRGCQTRISYEFTPDSWGTRSTNPLDAETQEAVLAAMAKIRMRQGAITKMEYEKILEELENPYFFLPREKLDEFVHKKMLLIPYIDLTKFGNKPRYDE